MSADVDPENVWHTLVLLDLSSIERMRRGLLLGQTVNLFSLRELAFLRGVVPVFLGGVKIKVLRLLSVFFLKTYS